MRRPQRHVALLLIGVLVLAALAFWQWQRSQASTTLLDIDPAAVTRIDVTRAGEATRHYVKRAGHWFRRDAPHEPVDAAQLAALAALARTPVLEWRKASSMNSAKIGLAPPPLIVRLNGYALAWGALAAFGPQRFVRVGSRIAVVPARYSPSAPAPASAASSQKS